MRNGQHSVAAEKKKSNISDSTDHANEHDKTNYEPKSTRIESTVASSVCIWGSDNSMVSGFQR